MVYVDDVRPCLPNNRWRWSESAHLYADDVDDLHAFAEMIGLKRSWFQSQILWFPHYDLTRRLRQRAIMKGARRQTRKEIVAFIRVGRQAVKEREAREQASREPQYGFPSMFSDG